MRSAKSSHSSPGHTCCPPGAASPESASRSLPPEASNPAEGAALSGAFKRSWLWFLTFFGIYASSSMCPFCGTPGCPVGVGGAALVGGFFATLWQYGGNVWDRLKRMVVQRER